MIVINSVITDDYKIFKLNSSYKAIILIFLKKEIEYINLSGI